jgi:hypothetical protein
MQIHLPTGGYPHYHHRYFGLSSSHSHDTAEVWTLDGLVTYYVLFFLHLGNRQVHVAGATLAALDSAHVQGVQRLCIELACGR